MMNVITKRCFATRFWVMSSAGIRAADSYARR